MGVQEGLDWSKTVLNTYVGNDQGWGYQCYFYAAYYVNKVGGPGMSPDPGIGFSHVKNQAITNYAKDIPDAYDWEGAGWSVIREPTAEDIKTHIGSVAVIRENSGAPIFTGEAGHVSVIASINGDDVHVYEQNAPVGSPTHEGIWKLADYDNSCSALCVPPDGGAKESTDKDGNAKDREKDKKDASSSKKSASSDLGHLTRYNDWLFGGEGNKSGNSKSATNSAGKNTKTGTGANTSATGKIADAFKACLDQSNWNSATDDGSPGIDIDGAFGAQCFDLGIFYIRQLGYDTAGLQGISDSIPASAHQSGWDKQNGWEYIENPTIDQLKVGAVVAEVGSFTHTEMVYAINGNSVTWLYQNKASPNANLSTEYNIGTSGFPVVAALIPPNS